MEEFSADLEKMKVESLKSFIDSNFYKDKNTNGISKSAYWEAESKHMKINIDKNGKIYYQGRSGFYVPQSKSGLVRFINKMKKIGPNPFKLVKGINSRLHKYFSAPRLLSYSESFDAVMNHLPITEPILSPYRVNHLSLKKTSGVFADLKSVKLHYEKWSNLSLSDNIIFHYYFLNLFKGFFKEDKIKTILEIGAGNGNFPSILFNDYSPKKIIIVDLPETIVTAYIFLSNLFPKARIKLPNEVKNENNTLEDEIDFMFLTPNQLKYVNADSVDLAININSFQEMKHKQVDVYFNFIQRVVKNSGYFFTVNRIEKIPSDDYAFKIEQTEPPIRFFEYPWNKKNKILINEVSRLHRLVQLHDIGIRLEKIKK